MACGAEKLADCGDAICAEEGELKGFFEGERELELANDLLDAHGVLVGHGGEGTAFRIGECFESIAEAMVAEEGADSGVKEEEKGVEVGPWCVERGVERWGRCFVREIRHCEGTGSTYQV